MARKISVGPYMFFALGVRRRALKMRCQPENSEIEVVQTPDLWCALEKG